MMPYHQIGACGYHFPAKLNLQGRRVLNEFFAPMDGDNYYIDHVANLLDIPQNKVLMALRVYRWMVEILSWPKGIAQKGNAQPCPFYHCRYADKMILKIDTCRRDAVLRQQVYGLPEGLSTMLQRMIVG